MQHFYLNSLNELIKRAHAIDSIILLKENLKKICKNLKEDISLNGFKNADASMEAIKQISANYLKSELKEVRVLHIEFLINLVLIFQEQTLKYFPMFFQIVVENFDEFDENLKRSAGILNDTLYDLVLACSAKMHRSISSLPKKITNFIAESKNERIRIMLLKWVYLVDSFQLCDFSSDLDIVVSNMLHLLVDPRKEIVDIAHLKIIKLIEKYIDPISADFYRFSKLLRMLIQSWQTIKLKQENEIAKKSFMQICEIGIISVLGRLKNSTLAFLDSGHSEGLFKIILFDIYLVLVKSTRDDEQIKNVFQNIKLIVKEIVRNQNEGSGKILLFLRVTLRSYRDYIISTELQDFRIVYEINEISVLFVGDSEFLFQDYNNSLQDILVFLFQNNLQKNTTQKFRAFISNNLYAILEKPLSTFLKFFDKMLSQFFEKVFFSDKQNIFENVRNELLYFFKNRISASDIFEKFATSFEFKGDPTFIIEFLNQELPKIDSREKRKIELTFYENSQLKFRESFYKSPVLFIVFNLLIGCFEVSSMVLVFLINDCLPNKTLKHAIRLNQGLDLLARHAIDLNEISEFHFSFEFKKFVGKLLMAMSQGEHFQTLMKNLKLMKMINQESASDLQNCQKYFQAFLDFLNRKDVN